MEDAKLHPVQLLALEAAAGNNPTLFDHHFTDLPATFSPAQAACYLLARQAYSIGFGKSKPFYFPDSTLIRGYSIFILGENLFQTLALNLLLIDNDRPIPRVGDDLPARELSALPYPDPKGNLINGYISYLTWQSRRIHLIPEGNPPVVHFCQIQQNWKLPASYLPDPFKSYRRDEKEGLLVRGLSPDREIWRDSHTLLELQGRPEILASLAAKRFALKEEKAYQFSITGVALEARKASNLVLWRHERLPLPLAYLEDSELLGELRVALDVCERAHGILQRHMQDLAALKMGVRVERQWTVKMDFHTAGGTHWKDGDYRVALADGSGKRPITSQRYYLADTDFLVGLESEDKDFLLHLDAALARPVWPLYLGRKAFVPVLPIRIS